MTAYDKLRYHSAHTPSLHLVLTPAEVAALLDEHEKLQAAIVQIVDQRIAAHEAEQPKRRTRRAAALGGFDRVTELWHTFTIECAHSLPGLGHGGIHGHSYWITVFYASSASDPVPLAMIEGYCALLRGRLDHQNLDKLMPQATMEAIAEWVAREVQGPRPTRVLVERPSIRAGVDYAP